MTAVNPTCFHQSASSIASFKACPTRYRLAYREGLRTAQDTDSQRQGTNWHAMHECYYDALRDSGHPDAALEAVVAHLNDRYTNRPNYKTEFEWALEQQMLVTCFIGYLWYYSEDPIAVIASEIAFNLPIHNPRLGLPLPMEQAQRVGKMDHVIRRGDMVGTLERKSTSRSIASDSDYWEKSAKDAQVSMYALAFRDMMNAKTLPPEIAEQIVDAASVGSTLYDVWHKPTIKPCQLSQKETKELIETGEYHGQPFVVRVEGDVPDAVFVDDVAAEVEIGKKGFSIKETIGMFAARLLADIYERPDFYFVRREIARTDGQLQHFRKEVYNIYQAQRMLDKAGTWFENESQCRATFPCSYIPICYGPGADAVCDGQTTPAGFKRIFVDLTVNGSPIAEE